MAYRTNDLKTPLRFWNSHIEPKCETDVSYLLPPLSGGNGFDKTLPKLFLFPLRKLLTE